MSLSPRHIPNIISPIRILLVAPIVIALAHQQLTATIAFILALAGKRRALSLRTPRAAPLADSGADRHL